VKAVVEGQYGPESLPGRKDVEEKAEAIARKSFVTSYREDVAKLLKEKCSFPTCIVCLIQGQIHFEDFKLQCTA